jgi:L-iditol 2-dehydrogenase
MRALVCTGPGEASLRDVPEPVPGPGEIVVRVTAALTCGTDLKLFRRGHPKIPFPLTLGHEFSGVVESVGAGAPFAHGERVTSAVTAPCGTCDACRARRGNLCESAFTEPLWGAFAERLRVPARIAARGVKRVPACVSWEGAALLDPLASVVHGLGRVPVERGTAALLIGAGPVAYLFASLLSDAGVRVSVVGRRTGRLARFEALGAERLTDRPESRRFSLVVDTTGDPAICSSLPALAEGGGTVLLFAGMAGGARVEMDAFRVHYEEVSVVGSFHYTPADADRALTLLADGRIPVEGLVTATRPLAEWAGAFEDVTRGSAMKVALIP